MFGVGACAVFRIVNVIHADVVYLNPAELFAVDWEVDYCDEISGGHEDGIDMEIIDFPL